MIAVANEIGNSICKYYDEDYLELLFEDNQIAIEDVIFQILVECCRYAYLSNSEKHPIMFYIERDKLEQETGRKTIKRIIDYVNTKYDVEEKRIKESIGEQILKPKDTEPIKTKNNRYPEYQLSEFAYWELRNIHDMGLVKAIVERRIGSSKKVTVDHFLEMTKQYDDVIKSYKEKFLKTPEDTVFSSMVLFTLQCRYSLDFYYQISKEMEENGVKEIPNQHDRLMTMSGAYKCISSLPNIMPEFAHDSDRIIEYPPIIQRIRFVNELISKQTDELLLARMIEFNVLANAVQSHIYLNGLPMRTWFLKNTTIDDWASVFETYNVFRTFVSEKDWTEANIQAVRKMYDCVSFDYKK